MALFIFGCASASAAGAAAGPAIRDVSVPGGSDKALADVYCPDSEKWTGPRPAVLVIHGGGWARGDKADRREQITCSALAARGIVAVSLNYDMFTYENGPWKGKKTHEAWPHNLRDVEMALRWMKMEGAKAHNIDPERVALLGYSSGAHLGLLEAYTLGKNGAKPGELPSVRGVVSVYGTHDLRLFGAFVFELKNADDDALVRRASPVTHLRPGVPATLVIHGEDDTTISPSVARDFVAKLEAAGVPHQSMFVPGRRHGFALGAPSEKPATDLAWRFLDECFSSAATSK